MIAVNLTLLCCAPLDFVGDSFIVETEVEMSVEASVISSVKSSLISSGTEKKNISFVKFFFLAYKIPTDPRLMSLVAHRFGRVES